MSDLDYTYTVVSDYVQELIDKKKLANDEKHYTLRLRQALIESDIEEIESIYDELLLTEKKRPLRWYKNQILEVVGCSYTDIEDILHEIKSYEVADLILECIEGSSWITSLPKKSILKYDYKNRNDLKKRLLLKKQKNYLKKIKEEKILIEKEKRTSLIAYEKQIKLQRRKLEKELEKINMGRNKARRISKILLSF